MPYARPQDVLDFYEALGVTAEVASNYSIVTYVAGVGHLLKRSSPKDVSAAEFAAKLTTFASIGGRGRQTSASVTDSAARPSPVRLGGPTSPESIEEPAE